MPGVQTASLLFSPELLQDPYPIYRQCLSQGLVHRVEGRPGMWAVFRYADCASLIRDPRLSARRSHFLMMALPPEQRAEFAPLMRLMQSMMLFFDAPEHTRLRKLMNKGFDPSAVDSLRPTIQAIVDKLFDPLKGKSEFDIVKDIAYPLPVRVISEMLGVPESLHEQFIAWSDTIAVFLGNIHRTVEQTRAAQQAAISLTDFFRDAVAASRRKKSGDLINLLIKIEEDGEVMTEEELLAQCVLLLLAGHETTRNLIGNGMYTLLRHPDALAQLRQHPDMIRTAIEELLRYESPIQYTARVLKEDMQLDGVQIRPGEVLLFMLGAANRDPSQFDQPDDLNLKRLNNSHLSFGAGAHFCIGNQLARLEGQAAILRLLQNFPQMRLRSNRADWAHNFDFRGLKTLPVEI